MRRPRHKREGATNLNINNLPEILENHFSALYLFDVIPEENALKARTGGET
jgi:hypothetical protein